MESRMMIKNNPKIRDFKESFKKFNLKSTVEIKIRIKVRTSVS
jgi:hypothetical protein